MNAFERASEIFGELEGFSTEESLRILERDHSGEAEEVLTQVRQMVSGSAQPVTGLDRAASTTPQPKLQAPKRVGSYEVGKALGEGGMGVVYEARQENPSRTVALKLLKLGFGSQETLRRFRIEAEVLGWLNHPGIAQIYEAGTAEVGGLELPFIAMELVHGQRIDRYVQEQQLPVEARLELIIDLCEAVHHAHQKGVVHRDLKPANILVSKQGQIKVLDFGIARFEDRPRAAGEAEQQLHTRTLHTRTGDVVGTLPYMSPEQIAGDPAAIDTRSDVYSLGAVAFELLAGQRPLDLARSSLAEAAQRISQEEPTTLGALNRNLRGDIEIIVAKALAKEKERRYTFAEDMARDIRRHLSDEPIEARRTSRLYQLKKFAQRNRVLVGGLAAVLISLTIGLLTSLKLYRQSEQRGEALTIALQDAEDATSRAVESETEAVQALGVATEKSAQSEQIRSFMVDLLTPQAWDDRVWSPDDPITLRRVIQGGIVRIENDLELFPRVRLELMTILADRLADIGERQEAVGAYERALEGIRALEPQDPELELNTAIDLASVRSDLGQYREQLVLYNEVLESIQQLRMATPYSNGDLVNDDSAKKDTVPPYAQEEIMALRGVAFAESCLGDLKTARQALEQALEIQASIPNSSHLTKSALLNSLGLLLADEGDYAESDRVYGELIEHAEAQDEIYVMDLAMYYASRGQSQRLNDDLDAAQASYEGGLELAEIIGENYVDRHLLLTGLGGVRRLQGNLDEAEKLVLEGLKSLSKDTESRSAYLVSTVIELADIRHTQKRYAQATEDFISCLELLSAKSPSVAKNRELIVSRLGAVFEDCARDEGNASLLALLERVRTILDPLPAPLQRWAEVAAEVSSGDD